MTALPLAALLARRKPAPNAKGEGIRTARAFRRATTEMYEAKIFTELDRDLRAAVLAALSRPVQSGGR